MNALSKQAHMSACAYVRVQFSSAYLITCVRGYIMYFCIRMYVFCAVNVRLQTS